MTNKPPGKSSSLIRTGYGSKTCRSTPTRQSFAASPTFRWCLPITRRFEPSHQLIRVVGAFDGTRHPLTCMKLNKHQTLTVYALSLLALGFQQRALGAENIGVGAKPLPGAEVILDGSRKTLDEKWTYWKGQGFKSS